jgi:hypothetical protein
LKNLIFFVLVIIVGFSYYSKNGGTINFTPTSTKDRRANSVASNIDSYQCDGRQHCSQMGSFEEAKYFIENCPNTKMDGDNDGIPCERQFGQ